MGEGKVTGIGYGDQNRPVSEVIREFIGFLSQAESAYNLAKEKVSIEDKRTQDLLHAIEFEPNGHERNKLATKLKETRVERRQNKNVVEEMEPVIEWLSDAKNKHAVEMLKQALGKVRKQEEYHKNRTYHPKVEDGR